MNRTAIEGLLLSKRRERDLYVSPDGVAKCHAEIDRLLDEWEQADAVGEEPPTRCQVPNA